MRSAVASPSATVLLCVVLAGSGNSADPLFDTSDERNYDSAKDLNAAMEERLLQGQYAGHQTPLLSRKPPRGLFASYEEYLDFAAFKGKMNEVRFALMTGGADINQQPVQVDKATPLIRAADQGHTELVAMFVKAGADTELRSADGETALMRAAANNHAEAVRELLEGGAKADAKSNNSGFTPIRMAASRGHAEALEYLVDASTPEVLDQQDTQGFTALMYAAGAG